MSIKPFRKGRRATAAAVFLLSPLCLLLSPAPAPSAPHTPEPGSVEREAILDAVRAPVQEQAGQPVVFHDAAVRVQGGWAFVNAVARDSRGAPVYPDVRTQALLRRGSPSGSSAPRPGRWRVLYWDAAGDAAPVAEALKRYPHAPRSLFGLPPNALDSTVPPLPVVPAAPRVR